MCLENKYLVLYVEIKNIYELSLVIIYMIRGSRNRNFIGKVRFKGLVFFFYYRLFLILK